MKKYWKKKIEKNKDYTTYKKTKNEIEKIKCIKNEKIK